MSQEKTQKATPKKIKDARKKGNLLSSQDILMGATFLSAIMILDSQYIKILESMMGLSRKSFAYSGLEFTMDCIQSIFYEFSMVIIENVLPIFLTIALVAVSFKLVQTKFAASISYLKPKASNLNPLNGIKRMFSIKSLAQLVKNILKLAAIGIVGYLSIKDKINIIPHLSTYSTYESVIYISEITFSILKWIALTLMIIGIMDYAFQRWQYYKKLKMSMQEVRDEHKHQEGNPQIKSRVRQIQRQMANMRMMQQVPNANVIIRNPTHFAVALKYDEEKASAPIVVAKGQNDIALKIIDIAQKNNVHILTDKPLARTLYKSVDVDQEIPYELYVAVAKILAIVFNLNNGG